MAMTQARLTSQDIASLLSQSVGDERALALVEQGCEELKRDPQSMTEADALEVLEHLAGQSGLVGIAARFAKGRAHLRWSQR